MALDYTPNIYRDNALMNLKHRLEAHRLPPMSCFISYCWSETMKPFASQLRDDLEKAGLATVFDMEQSLCGARTDEEDGFIQQLYTVDRVVLCCTPDLKERYENRLQREDKGGVISKELDIILKRLGQELDVGKYPKVVTYEEKGIRKAGYLSDILPIWCESDSYKSCLPAEIRAFGEPVCLDFNGQGVGSEKYDKVLWDLLKALYRTGQNPALEQAFDLTWQEWESKQRLSSEPVPDVTKTLASLKQAADLKSIELELPQLMSFYVPPDGVPYVGASSENRLNLSDEVILPFLNHDRQRVCILLGEAGAGKTLAGLKLEKNLWEAYESEPDALKKKSLFIPLRIELNRFNHETVKTCVQRTLIASYGLGEAEIKCLKANVRIVFILDGYDEVSGGVIESSQDQGNLYETNELGHWQGKVIVTGRTEHLSRYDYRGRFRPFQSGSRLRLGGRDEEKDVFIEWYVAPLTVGQSDDYLRRCCEQGILSEADHAYHQKHQNDERIQTFTASPILLSLYQQSLPYLREKGLTLGSESELYKQFMAGWFSRQKEKLEKQTGINRCHIEWSFQAFSMELAFAMFEGETSIARYREPVKEMGFQTSVSGVSHEEDFSRWARFFNNEDKETMQARQGCPLRGERIKESRPGIQHVPEVMGYRFMHQTFLEYFISVVLWEKLIAGIESVEAGSNSSDICAYWGARLLMKSPDALPVVLQFLSEKLQKIPSSEKQKLISYLYQMIEDSKGKTEESKGNQPYRIAASNAMTVLNYANHSFALYARSHPRIFQDIAIPYADLSKAELSGIDFSRSDLTGVTLESAILENTNLSEVCLEGVHFNQTPFIDHESGLSGLVYMPKFEDENYLATASGCKIYLWHQKLGEDKEWEEVETIETEHTHITTLSYEPVKQYLASGGKGGKIHLFWFSENRWDKRMLWRGKQPVNHLAFSKDGRWLGWGSDDRVVRLWDLRNNFSLEKGLFELNHDHEVKCIAFSSNNQFAAGDIEGQIDFWRIEETTESNKDTNISLIPEGTYQAHHPNSVNSLAFSPDGERLVSGGGHSLFIWDAMKKTRLLSFQEHEQFVTRVAYSPNGRYIVSGSQDKLIRLFLAENGKALSVYRAHTKRVTHLAFSSTGKQLISGSRDNTIRFWEVEQGLGAGPVSQGHQKAITDIAFSPKGEWIASSSEDRTVRLWRAEDGQAGYVYRGHDSPVLCVAFSQDGQWIASAEKDNVIHIFGVESGENERIFYAHEDWVRLIGFSMDDNYLVSQSWQNERLIHQISNGELISLEEAEWAETVLEREKRCYVDEKHMRRIHFEGTCLYLEETDLESEQTIRLWSVDRTVRLTASNCLLAGARLPSSTKLVLTQIGAKVNSDELSRPVKLLTEAKESEFKTMLTYLKGWLAAKDFMRLSCFIIYISSKKNDAFIHSLSGYLSYLGLHVLNDPNEDSSLLGPKDFREAIREADRVIVCCEPHLKYLYEVPSSMMHDALNAVFTKLSKSADAHHQVISLILGAKDNELKTAIPEPLQGIVRVDFRERTEAGMATSNSYRVAFWELFVGLYQVEKNPDLKYDVDAIKQALREPGFLNFLKSLWDSLGTNTAIETWGKRYFMKSPKLPEVVSFLSMKVRQSTDEDNVIDKLYALITASKGKTEENQENAPYRIAASNAMTVLNDANHAFAAYARTHPKVFEGIAAPYANLMQAELSGIDFRGSDLSHAWLERAILDHTNLRETNLDGVEFRQMPAIFVDGKVRALSTPQPSAGGGMMAVVTDGSRDIQRWMSKGEGYEAMLPIKTNHEGDITSVSMSPDGAWIASGSWDRTVRLWRFSDGRAGPVCWGHESWVNSVALNGDWIVSGSADKTVRLWRLSDGSAGPVCREHEDIVASVALNEDWIVSGSRDCTVRLWRVPDGRAGPVCRGHERLVSSVALNGGWIVSGSDDRTVRLWRVSDGSAGPVCRGHEERVASVALNGDWIVSGSDDRTVRLWRLSDGSAGPVCRGHENIVASVALNGDWIVSGSKDSTVRLWRLSDGSAGPVCRGHEYGVLSVALNGDWIASGSRDRTVRLWRLSDGRAGPVCRGHEYSVWSVALNGDWIASGSSDKTVRLWRLSDGSAGPVCRGHEDWVTRVAFSPTGDMIASISRRNPTYLVHRVTDGSLMREASQAPWVKAALNEGRETALLASGIRLRAEFDGKMVYLVEENPNHDTYIRLWSRGREGVRLTAKGCHFFRSTGLTETQKALLVQEGGFERVEFQYLAQLIKRRGKQAPNSLDEREKFLRQKVESYLSTGEDKPLETSIWPLDVFNKHAPFALHLACVVGKASWVEACLSSEAGVSGESEEKTEFDVNGLDKGGMSPLQLVVIMGHTDLIELLLQSGARVTQTIEQPNPLAGKNALNLSILTGHVSCTLKLMSHLSEEEWERIPAETRLDDKRQLEEKFTTLDLGCLETMYDYYQVMLRFNPNSNYDHHNFACYAEAKGEFEKAKRHFEKALEIERAANTMVEYANCLIQSKRFLEYQEKTDLSQSSLVTLASSTSTGLNETRAMKKTATVEKELNETDEVTTESEKSTTQARIEELLSEARRRASKVYSIYLIYYNLLSHPNLDTTLAHVLEEAGGKLKISAWTMGTYILIREKMKAGEQGEALILLKELFNAVDEKIQASTLQHTELNLKLASQLSLELGETTLQRKALRQWQQVKSLDVQAPKASAQLSEHEAEPTSSTSDELSTLENIQPNTLIALIYQKALEASLGIIDAKTYSEVLKKALHSIKTSTIAAEEQALIASTIVMRLVEFHELNFFEKRTLLKETIQTLENLYGNKHPGMLLKPLFKLIEVLIELKEIDIAWIYQRELQMIHEMSIDSVHPNAEMSQKIEAQAKKLASMDKKTRAGLGSVVSSSTSMMLNEGMAAEDKNDMDIETGRSERVLSASGTDGDMLFDTDEAAVTEKNHRSQNFLNRFKRNVKEQFGDHKKQKKDDNKGIYRFRLFENSERRANELPGEEGSTSAAPGENTANSLNLEEKRSPETSEESTLPTPPSL